VLVAISKGMRAEKLCTDEIQLMQYDLYNGRKMMVIVVALAVHCLLVNCYCHVTRKSESATGL